MDFKPVLNLRRQAPDSRDFGVDRFLHAPLTAVPTTTDLRTPDLPNWNQGAVGACTSFATALAVLAADSTRTFPLPPSWMFLYNAQRLLQGTPLSQDAGSDLRTAVKIIHRHHVPPATAFPYTGTNVTKAPPRAAYHLAAGQLRPFQYVAVPQTMSGVKSSIASGFPVVFGMLVYESFYAAGSNGGFIPVPDPSREGLEGGHALCIVGYTPTHFILRNSWGTSWGDGGDCYITPEHLLDADQCWDFWAIEMYE
jgi:hypothetical protein